MRGRRHAGAVIESTGVNKINVSASASVNATNANLNPPSAMPRDTPLTAKSPPTGYCLALMVTGPGRSYPGSKIMLVVMGSNVCSFTQMGLPTSALTS